MSKRWQDSLIRSVAVSIAILAGLQAMQAQQRLVVDPAHSEIHFTLVDTLHTVHGTFHAQPSEIVFNPASGEASGLIAVDALSGQSGNSVRDRRMTKEELKADSFKIVTFAPTRFTGTFNASGDSTLQVAGTFSILGSAHPLNVPMKVHIEGDDVHMTGSFSVPYVSWGLKDPSAFMIKVNKDVQIDLALTGKLQH